MDLSDDINFVTSDDEQFLSPNSQKRKVEEQSDVKKPTESQPPKRPRPANGSGFNLVSYDLDNDDMDSDADESPHSSQNSDDKDAVDEEPSIGNGGLQFIGNGSGPLTVLSSEHIEVTQNSPSTTVEEPNLSADEKGNGELDTNKSGSPENGETEAQASSDVELPPEPKETCSMQLQMTVESTIRRMQHDVSFDPNRVIQDNKAFRNPSIYKKLINYLDIDEKGTNFSPEVYNPYRWTPNDYYDKLAEVQNREVERLDKLQKERRKAEASGASGTNAAAASALSRASSGPALSSSGASSAEKRSSEGKKKSKWDTVASSEAPTSTATTAPTDSAPKVTIPALGDLFHKK